MTAKAAATRGATLRRFVDAVSDLAEEPTAPNVARYLRASTELERATSRPRTIRSRRPRGEHAESPV